MKVFTYSEARQKLSKLLVMAQKEEIEIQRRDGSVFSLRVKRRKSRSPFDIPGVGTGVSSKEIVNAVRESRKR